MLKNYNYCYAANIKKTAECKPQILQKIAECKPQFLGKPKHFAISDKKG